MKNLLLALGLVAVTGTLVWVIVAVTEEEKVPRAPWRDASAMGPSAVPVLSASRPGLEILVKARFARDERARFTDASLSRALGAPDARLAFVEVVVVNGGTEPVLADPGLLELALVGGETVPITPLRALADDPNRALHLLAALSPPAQDPVAPGTVRRLLVGIPASTAVDALAGGRFLGLELRSGHAHPGPLDAWLEKPRPRLLASVLENDERDEPAGGKDK